MLSWKKLYDAASSKVKPSDLVNGLTSSQSTLRLFGKPSSTKVRVTLFRDNHAWYDTTTVIYTSVWLYYRDQHPDWRIFTLQTRGFMLSFLRSQSHLRICHFVPIPGKNAAEKGNNHHNHVHIASHYTGLDAYN